jgi:hypothetical protein
MDEEGKRELRDGEEEGNQYRRFILTQGEPWANTTKRRTTRAHRNEFSRVRKAGHGSSICDHDGRPRPLRLKGAKSVFNIQIWK